MKELLNIVDETLSLWIADGVNTVPVAVPQDMAAGVADDDWHFWVPVPSRVTGDDIREVEAHLGVRLPPQYKALLRHKHYLGLHIGDVGFFPHPTTGWKDILLTKALQHYGFLLERGLLAFATFNDWGLWCFSVREADPDGEYHIYQWDHDRPDEAKYVGASLLDALRAQRTSMPI